MVLKASRGAVLGLGANERLVINHKHVGTSEPLFYANVLIPGIPQKGWGNASGDLKNAFFKDICKSRPKKNRETYQNASKFCGLFDNANGSPIAQKKYVQMHIDAKRRILFFELKIDEVIETLRLQVDGIT